MRRIIIGIIVGLIIGISTTATAAYVYTASDIGYQPSDEAWNVSNASEALSSLKTDITNMQNLSNQGSMVYDAGTNIVGLVSDNSPYVDSNGNYVLASSTLGQSMIDNVTYKSIEAPSEIKGNVGAEIVTPFNSSVLQIHGMRDASSKTSLSVESGKRYVLFIGNGTSGGVSVSQGATILHSSPLVSSSNGYASWSETEAARLYLVEATSNTITFTSSSAVLYQLQDSNEYDSIGFAHITNFSNYQTKSNTKTINVENGKYYVLVISSTSGGASISSGCEILDNSNQASVATGYPSWSQSSVLQTYFVKATSSSITLSRNAGVIVYEVDV